MLALLVGTLPSNVSYAASESGSGGYRWSAARETQRTSGTNTRSKHWLAWCELLQGKGLRGSAEGLVLLGDSNGLELDLMEKTFAMAHFKSKCSRALGGSNQGKKQVSS